MTGIRALTLAFMVLPLLGTAPQRGASLESVMIDIHNSARSVVGVPPVTWDPMLATHAQTWANHLVELGRLEHSKNEDRPGEGENLAGAPDTFSPEQLAGLWVAEKANFVNGTMPDISRTGRWQDAGHYSQMVWRNTSRIGCAMAGGGFLVCRYAPPGNYIGQKAL